MRKIILLISLLVIISLFLTACGCFDGFVELLGPREPMNIATFRSVMESEGYEVVDMLYDTDQFDTDVFGYYLIVYVHNYYRFEFVKFTSEQYAISAFNANRARIEANNSGVVFANRRIDGINHNLFERTSAGIFSYLYRVDNTLLYVSADSQHRDHVRELIERLK